MRILQQITAPALVVLALSRPIGASASERMMRVAPGVELHVLDSGPAGRPPALVLIPGWCMAASVWKAQIEFFSRTRRVVAIDPRSQGESTKVAEGDTPEQRARDLDAVMKQLGLGSVVLVGWSQGVQDVAAYVEAFGTGSLRGVVLVDAPVSSGAQGIPANPAAASMRLRMLSLYSRAPRDYAEGMMRAIFRRPLSAAELEGLVSNALKTPTAIGVAMLVADLFGVDRTPALAKLDRPTLVIAAATSTELEAQKAMTARLPQGRFEVVPDAGHAVFVDQPQRFDDLLQEFLDGLS